jgi:hypothetical protein
VRVITADIEALSRNLIHDPTDVFSRTKPDCDADHQNRDTIPAAGVARLQEDKNTPTAEQVAGVVAVIPAIGKACHALREAGWRATIAGNRITVNDEVFAQFIGAVVGPASGVDARWVIHRIAGTPPVWVVGAEGQL